MAARTVVGVDFSGAKERNTTQFTMGVLNGAVLELKPYESLPKKLPATHNKLLEVIKGLSSNDVVALDFPFSVPKKFAEELSPNATTMDSVWRTVAEDIKEYHVFKKLRDRFVERYREMARRGDSNFGGPISPLKTGGPSMLQMTFYGMKMLHELWENSDCRIPPLPFDGRKGPVLLETMPGVLLRIFGLPYEKYKKTYKDQRIAQKNRKTIRDGLSDKKKTDVSLEKLDLIPPNIRDNDDWLDSLVAAICAAKWTIAESGFLIPDQSIPRTEEFNYALIEGWIYAPKPLKEKPSAPSADK